MMTTMVRKLLEYRMLAVQVGFVSSVSMHVLVRRCALVLRGSWPEPVGQLQHGCGGLRCSSTCCSKR